MKFKYLIISLSIIIVITILVTALLPILLDFDDSSLMLALNLRSITFPLLLLMIVLLVFMSIFFFYNYRLFSLLEREDWPALSNYLEQEIYVKGRYNGRNVRLLASSYLAVSDYQSAATLESKTMLNKPSIVNKNALVFGAIKILNCDYEGAASFFKTHIEKHKATQKQWLLWFLGFSYLLSGLFDEAEQEFAFLAVFSKNALITGLCAYFLINHLENKSKNPQKCREISEKGRERIIFALKNTAGWQKEVDKAVIDIHIAIIKKYISQAGIWLFK